MSLTLLMTWDIRPGLEQDYFQFIVGDWTQATKRIGLNVTAAWLTHYRADDNTPMIRFEAVVADHATMRRILEHPDWVSLRERLDEYILNYQQKVLETSGEFLL